MSNLIQEALEQICEDQHEIAVLREQVEKLTESVAYWKSDSAAAWDKCEERRIENEKRTKERDAYREDLAVITRPT